MAINKTQKEKWADYALWFTMAAAILSGLFWALSAVSKSFDKQQVLANIFSGLTVVGGTVMGVLYLSRKYGQK